MFDPQTKDRPLSQQLTRALIIGAVVVLVTIGVFTLLRDQFTEDEKPAAPSAEPSPEPTAILDPPDRSTLEEVDDWFPHSRTEFAEAGQAAETFRSIPACAGLSAAPAPGSTPAPVHPRVRGALVVWLPRSFRYRGPSPRARGSLSVSSDMGLLLRSIPACAGLSSGGSRRRWRRW